ncbi:hypothetical protein FE257_009706 [Aspergillus nanangensis]|uniref:Uncharacterized protein n=1 Tax=Aspergillus nanangensis TaxID=2582783 RepID=A0AAD4CKU9_ASPNN|nr:hypothetical protein FE257_009706 [Aspergillus nanangensis]
MGRSATFKTAHGELLYHGDQHYELLLTCLPNIAAIDAHVSPSDPVLGIVLEESQQQSQSPLSAMIPNLTQGRLRSGISPEREGRDNPLQLTHMWLVMLYPWNLCLRDSPSG